MNLYKILRLKIDLIYISISCLTIFVFDNCTSERSEQVADIISYHIIFEPHTFENMML